MYLHFFLAQGDLPDYLQSRCLVRFWVALVGFLEDILVFLTTFKKSVVVHDLYMVSIPCPLALLSGQWLVVNTWWEVVRQRGCGVI